MVLDKMYIAISKALCRALDAKSGSEHARDENPLAMKVIPTAITALTQQMTYFKLAQVENENNSQKHLTREQTEEPERRKKWA